MKNKLETARFISAGQHTSFEMFLSGEVRYVDKTTAICELAKYRESFLLTRPRRMGKTTMVSTLKYLFANGTVGTEKLACHTQWPEPNRYFVFHFSWHKLDASSALSFKQTLFEDLVNYAKYFGITLDPSFSLRTNFETLINDSLKKLSDPSFMREHPELSKGDKPFCSKEAILLIDEYDAPLTKNLDETAIFNALRNEYSQFFSAVKDLDFRFVLITGVSSYAQTSIFSGANQFKNISLDEPYATCCGYTQAEIELNFAGELDNAQKVLNLDNRSTLLAQMRHHYDGYLFSKVINPNNRLFSPVSVSSFLMKPQDKFEPYWTETAHRSTFLFKLLKSFNKNDTHKLFGKLYPEIFNADNELDPKVIEYIYSWFPALTLAVNNEQVDEHQPKFLSAAIDSLIVKVEDVEAISPTNAIPLLFQTGYLSIKDIRGSTALLGFANHEVAVSLAKLLTDQIKKEDKELYQLKGEYEYFFDQYTEVFNALHEGGSALAALINRILNSAPWELCYDSNHENVVTYTIYQPLHYSGVPASREVRYIDGRADLIIYQPQPGPLVEDVVIEFKIARTNESVTTKLKQACKQMTERKYGISLLNPHPKRYCIVISNALKEVGAIAELDENDNWNTVYVSTELNSRGVAKAKTRTANSSSGHKRKSSSQGKQSIAQSLKKSFLKIKSFFSS